MKIKVNKEDIRIDLYLRDDLNKSRSYIKNNIKYIKVNGEEVKPNFILTKGDEISVSIKEEEIEKTPFNLEILYEDEYMIAINKPSNLVVYPGSGKETDSVLQQIKSYTNELSNIYKGREGLVHRLDKETSGVLLIAKDNKTHELLSNLFKERTIEREYHLIVDGVINEDTGLIDAPIGRDQINKTKMTVTGENSKDAITHFEVIERLPNNTYLKAFLETGRTHQIRVHFKYIEKPIYNDSIYNKVIDDKFIYLHAKSLKFIHPYTSKNIDINSKLPNKFDILLNNIRGDL